MPDKQTVSKPKSFLSDVLRDVHVYGGIAAISVGVWLAFGLAAALIVCGTLTLALGVFAIIWSSL